MALSRAPGGLHAAVVVRSSCTGPAVDVGRTLCPASTWKARIDAGPAILRPPREAIVGAGLERLVPAMRELSLSCLGVLVFVAGCLLEPCVGCCGDFFERAWFGEEVCCSGDGLDVVGGG